MHPTSYGPIDPILTVNEVTSTIVYSRSQIYRMVKKGAFPAPLRLGPARVGWRRSAVADWISAREGEAKRPAPPP